MRSSGPLVLRDSGDATSAEADKKCARAVFNAFRAILRHRDLDQNPLDTYQNAFDVAVRTYCERKPDVPEEEARRAVANLICRRL